MYIGSVSTKGLNHLIYEIVDNSVDEHLAGYCDTIKAVSYTHLIFHYGDTYQIVPFQFLNDLRSDGGSCRVDHTILIQNVLPQDLSLIHIYLGLN